MRDGLQNACAAIKPVPFTYEYRYPTRRTRLIFRVNSESSSSAGCAVCVNLGQMALSDSSASQNYPEKRSVPRYMLIATVEVEESTSGARISGRVSEISRKGCYIDVLNTLPPGTMVRLRIIRDKGTFFTRGRIIYVHEGIGMGVLFVDTAADQMEILDAWIADLAS
jgi:hypothetical protein